MSRSGPAWPRLCLRRLLLLLLAGLYLAGADERCVHGETWQPVTQRCACHVGHAAADCSEPLHPSCAVTTGPHGPHGWPAAQSCATGWLGAASCACRRECAERPTAVSLDQDARCFERTAPGASNFSAFPAPGEQDVRWWSNWRPDHRTELTEGTYFRDDEESVVVPLDLCPQSCSFEGVCLQRRSRAGTQGAPQCLCPGGYESSLQGAACELASPAACAMNCSGGTCARGVCLCPAGRFGLGCGETAAALATAPRHPPAGRLAIYVWLPSSHVGEAMFIDHIWGGHAFKGVRAAARIYGPAGHYGAGDVFLTRLLEDGTARAASPESANLHLVPTFPFEWGDSGGGENLVEHLARVVEDMNSTAAGAAALARRGGTDFVLLATGDRGACTLRPPLTSLVVAAEYGQTRAGGGGGGPGGWCMHPLRGVVLPTAITDPAAACREAALTYGGDGGGGEDTKMVGGGAADPGPAHHQPARDLLLYFSGVLGNRGDATYAQGVRRAVSDVMGNASDVMILGPDADEDTAKGRRWAASRPLLGDMFSSMRRAKFCLAPAGHGYGNRISYAMITGCVPVIIQDGVRQPLDDVLPYWRFTIRLAQAEIPRLETILRAVGSDELSSLQHHMKLYHHYFLWKNKELGADCGLAYQGVMNSLQLKAFVSESGLGI